MLRELALSIPQYGEFQAPGGVPTGGLNTTGGKIIQTGIGIAFLFAIILCLFVIIWGGVQWISSGGDKQKLATARSRIMYAIVGLIIVLLSFVIVNLFTTFLGLPSPMSINLFQTVQTPAAAESPPADDAVSGQPSGAPPPVVFSIERVFNVSQFTDVWSATGTPKAVRRGDEVSIFFTTPDLKREYIYGAHGAANPSGRCTPYLGTSNPNDCYVNYTIPGAGETGTLPPVVLDVLDPTTGEIISTPPINIE